MNEYPRTRFEEKREGGILMHLLLRRSNIKRQTQHFIRANLASAQWTLCPTMKQWNRCGTANIQRLQWLQFSFLFSTRNRFKPRRFRRSRRVVEMASLLLDGPEWNRLIYPWIPGKLNLPNENSDTFQGNRRLKKSRGNQSFIPLYPRIGKAI